MLSIIFLYSNIQSPLLIQTSCQTINNMLWLQKYKHLVLIGLIKNVKMFYYVLLLDLKYNSMNLNIFLYLLYYIL